MNPYRLSTGNDPQRSTSLVAAARRLAPVMAKEQRAITIAFVATLAASGASITAPWLVSRAVDTYIRRGDYGGVLMTAVLLLGTYLVGLAATYVQTQQMGLVGRRVLYSLRGELFTKLQELPLDFFNQNKSGDLISRINNDTDKLNVFFAQGLVQLAANTFLMGGAAVMLVSLNVRLGLAALVPALLVVVITRVTASMVKARNATSLRALGALSGDIQESMSNFRVIAAFNRVDYFKTQFEAANARNYDASVSAGLLNTFFVPLYGLAMNSAQVVVLAYGFALISSGQFTLGLLIGFLMYVNNVYMPMRQIAAMWSSFQLALASFDRVSDVLRLESNLPQLPPSTGVDNAVLAFDKVQFGYVPERLVLRETSFVLDHGKTYALVGPTGGGKTTTASLMARLYDPTGGRVLLDGRDIRTFTPAERARRIGFILQEPYLFTGTIKDNLLYGNDTLASLDDAALSTLMTAKGFDGLLARFEQGLSTAVTSGGEGISLGQRQLIAFMRAVLREPEILILDEATANIDTVTEQLLEQILRELPPTTTKVIIAHRLNTIENADEIFFINNGELTRAGSMHDALDLLLHHHRTS